MKKTILFIGLVCMALFSLASCSEKEDTIDDYNNWQQKNDDYWTTLYNATQQKVASGDSTWKCYLNWSLEGQLPNISGSTLSYSPTDYIIVHVEKTGTGTVSPSIQTLFRCIIRGGSSRQKPIQKDSFSMLHGLEITIWKQCRQQGCT